MREYGKCALCEDGLWEARFWDMFGRGLCDACGGDRAHRVYARMEEIVVEQRGDVGHPAEQAREAMARYRKRTREPKPTPRNLWQVVTWWRENGFPSAKVVAAALDVPYPRVLAELREERGWLGRGNHGKWGAALNQQREIPPPERVLIYAIPGGPFKWRPLKDMIRHLQIGWGIRLPSGTSTAVAAALRHDEGAVVRTDVDGRRYIVRLSASTWFDMSEPVVDFNLRRVYSPEEGAAIERLEWLRWGDEPRCSLSGCGSAQVYMMHDRDRVNRERHYRWYCRKCHRQFTVRHGTVMEKTGIPALIWLAAIEGGVAAEENIQRVQRKLGLTWKAARYLVQRLKGHWLTAEKLDARDALDARRAKRARDTVAAVGPARMADDRPSKQVA